MICKRSRNGRGRPSTASAALASLDRVSLVNIDRRRRDDWGRVSTCVQSNLLRAKTAVSPRSLLSRNDCFRRLWNLHVRLLLVSDHLPETTTHPNWNFPSESLQLQLVNDHLSWVTVATFFRWRPWNFPSFLSSYCMVWSPCMLYVLYY